MAGLQTAVPLGTGSDQACAGNDARLPFIVARASDSNPLTSQTTPQSDSTLIVPVTASSQWWIFATLLFTAANTAMDIKCGWSVPAAAVMTWGAGPSTTTSTVSVFAVVAVGNTPTGLLSESGTLSVGSRAGTSGVQLAAYAVIGANAGNVTFQWAQNTSDAGALTLLKGSLLQAWQIA